MPSRAGILLRLLRLSGRVFSGEQKGERYVSLPWVRKQVEEKAGFAPYPGTLNVRLTGQSVELRKTLVVYATVKIEPEVGYCSGLLIHAFFGRLKCAVILPLTEGYPVDVLEILAPVNLRKKFGLKDGDEVSFTVIV